MDLKVTNISLYSLTPNYIGAYIISEIKSIMGTDYLTITDMTANVGSDTIRFGMNFKNVNSIEIDKLTYELLSSNVKTYNLKNVNVIKGDSLSEIKKLNQDVIYIDPPWGGTEYKNYEYLDLSLGKMDVVDFIKNNINRAKLFVMKVPINFNFNRLLNEIPNNKISIMTIKKQEKKIMGLIFIKTFEYNNADNMKISRILNIMDYKDYIANMLFKHCNDKKLTLEEFKREMVNISEESKSDLEWYAYYHEKFKTSEFYKNYKEIKLKKLSYSYDRTTSILNKTLNLENKKILDLGAENCYMAKKMQKLYNSDVTSMNIGEIGSYEKTEECEIVLYDGVNIPKKDNSQDIVILLMTIHHMEKYIDTLKNVYRVLKNNGKVFIKEHKFENGIIGNDFVDVLHFIYELVLNSKFNSEYYNDYYIKRIQKNQLDHTMKCIGFKRDYGDERFYNKRWQIIGAYYSVFTK